MDLNLDNKVALVTGGSSGLGKAICIALAAEGARVAINYYRDPDREIDFCDQATELAQRIKSEHGVDALPVPGDVAKETDIEQMFRLSETTLGPVDILVNNAGVWPTGLVKDITEDEWNRTQQINLTGSFMTCREAVRRWLDTNTTGRIVNVTSQAAFRGSTTGHAHYAASKAGLVALTVSLAREVAAQGIAVNAVAPGMMRTEMARETLDTNEEAYLQRIPVRRIADPAEVAAVVTFLASDRASYMTGATVDATGGMLMR